MGVTRKNFGRGCAAGTLNTPPIHIISRLTEHIYSYNLHVKIPYLYNRLILVNTIWELYAKHMCILPLVLNMYVVR